MTNLPAPVGESLYVGLEDFDQEDMVMPRISINHDKSTFEDQLSKAQFDVLEAIPLGLVKQRICWPPEVSEGKSVPLCRSLDFQTGRPGDEFPWAATSFDPKESSGLLSCAACPLKEWGSNPKNDTPWCTEQMHFVLMTGEGGVLSPAIFTVQRSNIKAAKAYVTSFARRNVPLFTAACRLSLEGKRRGTVRYSTVEFAQGDPTDESMWAEWSETYKRIRAYLRTPFRADDEGDTPKSTSPRNAAAVEDGELEWETD